MSRMAVMFEVERRTLFGRAMKATDARLFHLRVVIFGEVPAADSPRTGRAVGRKRLNAEQSREESTTVYLVDCPAHAPGVYHSLPGRSW